MKGGTKLCISATVAAVGVVIAVMGVSFLHFFPVIFDETLKKQTRLVEGNAGYENWKNPPADIYIDFYMWHLENPLEVEKGAKPNVTQKGPYTYKENRTKQFIQDNQNGTLSFIQPQSFVFDPVHSVGDPKTDNFTTINMPLLTIINQLQYMPENYRYLFDVVATVIEKHIHSTHTVHDFIWGYFSPLLFIAKMLEPDMVPQIQFGIYVGKNNSNDGIYTVYDGVKDYTQTNSINNWKGMDRVTDWTSKYANMINGTDGTYFGQFLSKEEKVYIFVSDICRSVYATYKQDMDTLGVPTWRYTVPKPVFANQYVDPSNAAFCTPDKHSCLPGGILNVSNCQFGAPIYFSSPHFLYADDDVFDMINGVHPNETLHQTFLDIEPYSGAPLNVAKRSQINTYLRSYDFIEYGRTIEFAGKVAGKSIYLRIGNIESDEITFIRKFYKEVPRAYVPLVWMEERSVIGRETANQLQHQLMLPLALGKYAPWAAFSFGILLLLIGVGCFGHHWKHRKGFTSLDVNSLMVDEERRPMMDSM